MNAWTAVLQMLAVAALSLFAAGATAVLANLVESYRLDRRRHLRGEGLGRMWSSRSGRAAIAVGYASYSFLLFVLSALLLGFLGAAVTRNWTIGITMGVITSLILAWTHCSFVARLSTAGHSAVSSSPWASGGSEEAYFSVTLTKSIPMRAYDAIWVCLAYTPVALFILSFFVRLRFDQGLDNPALMAVVLTGLPLTLLAFVASVIFTAAHPATAVLGRLCLDGRRSGRERMGTANTLASRAFARAARARARRSDELRETYSTAAGQLLSTLRLFESQSRSRPELLHMHGVTMEVALRLVVARDVQASMRIYENYAELWGTDVLQPAELKSDRFERFVNATDVAARVVTNLKIPLLFIGSIVVVLVGGGGIVDIISGMQ